jgi:hypothetical protein
MATPVKIGDKTYPTMSAAAEALGISRQAIRHRVNAGTATAKATGDVGGRPPLPVNEIATDEHGYAHPRARLTRAQLRQLETHRRRWMRDHAGAVISREAFAGLLVVEALTARERERTQKTDSAEECA